MAETIEPVVTEVKEPKINVFETQPLTAPVVKAQAEKVEPIVEKKEEPKVAVEATEAKVENKAEPNVTAAKPEPIKFANEYSEKIFNLLKEGKEEDVYKVLSEKHTLSNIDKLPAERQIKLDIKYANPEFDDEELDAVFASKYQRPEKPELSEDPTAEEEAQYNKSVAKWEKANKAFEKVMSADAKTAAKNLKGKVSELALPDVPKAEKQPTPEELAAWQKQREETIQNIGNGLSEFGGFDTEYKDKSLQIPIKYMATEEDKTLLKPVLDNFDIDSYFGKRWNNADGTLNGKRLAEDVYILERLPKILQHVATESGNQRLAKHLAEQNNIDYSGGRQEPIETYNPDKVRDDMQSFFFKAR